MNCQTVPRVTLSILIVNFNGIDFLSGCLESIKRNIDCTHEIIVVDNASHDGSVDYLKQNYPEIKLIASRVNLGFAGGNNLGARYASGKFLLLLNNDTILLDNLSSVLALMENEPSVGIVGIRMLGREREYRKSAGYFPAPWRLIKYSSLYMRHNGFKHGVFHKDVSYYPVDWIEGSFLLSPLNVWREMGGLDESYFMYVEDVDYARRVTNAGMKVVYFPRLSYVHFGGYGQSRIGMLINGFRHYHYIHSTYETRCLANVILDFGLIARAIYSLLRSPFKGGEFHRAILCIKALTRRR